MIQLIRSHASRFASLSIDFVLLRSLVPCHVPNLFWLSIFDSDIRNLRLRTVILGIIALLCIIATAFFSVKILII